MSLEPELLEMLNATVSWEKCTGKDQYGNRTYAAPVPVDVFMGSLERRRGGNGQRQIETGMPQPFSGALVLDLTPAFTAYDKITLPNTNVVWVYEVVIESEENGPHHQEVLYSEENK